MAEKVERLINQPATRTGKGKPALDSSFDIKEMVKDIELLYEKVIYDSHGKS